jgi:hypothetical protein
MPPTINPMDKLTSLNETSRTMKRYSDGGALITQPNHFEPKRRVVPDLYISVPAVSSLPYLSEDQKVNTNESILQLSIDIANKKEQQRADWIYTDQENYLLENRISGDITKFAKEYEPSTEQLLRQYISGEIVKRKQEETAIENKRITGVDADIEKFKDDVDAIRSKEAIKRAEVLAGQEARAGRYHAEQLFKLASMGGRSVTGVSEKELQKRFLKNQLGSATPSENLEPPIQMVGMPSREQPVLDALRKPENETKLQNTLLGMYNTDYNSIKNSLMRQSMGTINGEIMMSNLSSFVQPTDTKLDKVRLLAYHKVSNDPKFRRSIESLGFPAPFSNSALPPDRSRLLDRLVEEKQGKAPIAVSKSKASLASNAPLKQRRKSEFQGDYNLGSLFSGSRAVASAVGGGGGAVASVGGGGGAKSATPAKKK